MRRARVDPAQTFCRIAGIAGPTCWKESAADLNEKARAQRRERVLTEGKEHGAVDMHLRTIYRDGYLCTATRRHVTRHGRRFTI
jgi:hypothetical protein